MFKLTSIAFIAAFAASTTAFAAPFVTFTSSVALTNPTSTGTAATVSASGGDATFKTADSDGDTFVNEIDFTHANGPSGTNAGGAGSSIVFARNTVLGYDVLPQTVGVDFAITLSFNAYADAAKTIALGTGTTVVNGHTSGLIGNGGADTTGTFTDSTLNFLIGSTSYKLTNFAYTPGGDFPGSIGARLQVVPEPASLSAIALSGTALLRRRRRA